MHILPVIPVPALSKGVLCEVGGEIEAGLGRLTPCTLAGVREAFTTRLPPSINNEMRIENKAIRMSSVFRI